MDQPVGIYHAIVGTLMITLFTAIISVPIGIMAAIYLVEYGEGSKIAAPITFLVDVMNGIPSIVAGLFAYFMFALLFGDGVNAGIGGPGALIAWKGAREGMSRAGVVSRVGWGLQ